MRILLLLGVVTWHVTSFNIVMADNASPTALEATAQSINAFSNNFFKAVAEDVSGNLISSPFSAYMVLSMATEGARGDTQKTFRSTLVLGENDALTKAGIQSLVDSFDNFKQVELRTANKIFLANNFQPKAEFMAITEGVYRSKSVSLDFGKSAEASKAINDWCEAKTNNRIKDLIKPSDLSSDTALVLVNAVYFKGSWERKFNAENTKPRPFHVDNSTVKDVPTMYRSGSYRYGELPEVKAKFVEVPYKSENASDAVSMIIILPDEIDGLAELEKNLDKVTVDKILRGNKRDVNLYLPKFKIESSIDLKTPLSKLGLGDMFTDKANFTGIVDAPPLKVSKVVQKAFIEVNEEGSEAAAATAMIAVATSALIFTNSPLELRVDHPFLYLIMMRSSRAIIFQGHILS